MMNQAWQQWVVKRFQFHRSKQLTQKDVLVFLYRQGYLYLVLILITFIAGVNYANNLILAFCFLISAILCISFYLTFKQLHGLTIEVVTTPLSQVGSALQLELQFTQTQKQARYLWIKTQDQLHKIALSEHKHSMHLQFLATQRGQFYYPHLQIYTLYPFGLVRGWTYLYLNSSCWVAPKALYKTAENKQQYAHFQPDFDEFRELRDFKIGDSLHAVSWKQAARGQGLYIKVFEQHQQQHSIAIDYAHMPSTSHEEKLSLMMGLVEQCEQQQCAYSVVLGQQHLASAVGEKQHDAAKLLLAQA